MIKKPLALLGVFLGYSTETKETTPSVEVKMKGIEASLEKCDGALLHYKPKNEGDEKKPASVGFHYVLLVRSTGENPEYPAWEKPRKYVFTQSLDGGSGFNGGVNYTSKDEPLAGFVIEEEFDDMSKPRMGPIRGCEFPPHHTIMIRMMCRKGGKVRDAMSLGIAVRKSETESPAWKRAENSPVMGMMI